MGDSDTALGNGYVYRVDGNDRWIDGDNIMKDGIYPNVIEYNADNDFIIILQEPTIKGYKRLLAQDLRYKYESIIYDKTENDVYKNRFINSHLWKDESIHRKVKKEMKPDNQASFEKINLIADSIITFDSYYKKDFLNKKNYWIIKKNIDSVLGPFSKQTYLKMRVKFHINSALKLLE